MGNLYVFLMGNCDAWCKNARSSGVTGVQVKIAVGSSFFLLTSAALKHYCQLKTQICFRHASGVRHNCT